MSHRCNDKCTCPIHKTQLIYSPKGDEHACQNVDCKFGHGVETLLKSSCISVFCPGPIVDPDICHVCHDCYCDGECHAWSGKPTS